MAEETAEEKQKRAAAEAAASSQTKEVKPVDIAPNEDAPDYRYFRAGKDDFSDETTFQVKMSSEMPVEMRAKEAHEKLGIAKQGEKFLEILSHEEGDVDLSLFLGENRAALLDEHVDSRHLGYIQTARLSKDKSTRGVIVFDKASRLSKTRCEQVRSDSRRNFSIGYKPTKYLGPTTLADGRTAHRFAFKTLELSSVAVPADASAQKGRSKNFDCHCIACGDIHERKELNKDFLCPDCEDAESPAEDERKQSDERMIRAKGKDGKDVRISHNEIRNKVNGELNNDKRFKVKRPNGDMVSDFYTHDIHLVSDSADEYQAIVSSPAWSHDGKTYAVDFQYDDGKVTLGDHTEVEPKTTFEAVDRAVPFDAKSYRKAAAVDLNKKTEAEVTDKQSRKNFMAKTVAELNTEAPDLVKEIETNTRTATEKSTRTAIAIEFKGEAGKRSVLVKEIRALADTFVKEKGPNFYGKPGEVTTVGERVRSFEHEALSAVLDETRSDSEIRSDFKQRANDVIRDSRAPKDPTQAANLPDTIAKRCSLGRILREGMRAADKTSGRANCFMIADGAEAEADKEIRKIANDFPGGADSLPEGIQLPWTMPSGVRGGTAMPRMGRDALAGDFSTAGALIAPSYEFPMIELLRNLPALSRAGMTMLSGLLGSPIVLPRQEAPTTGQSVAEGVALIQYDQVLGQIKLSAHRVGSSQKYGRLALLQATPDFEAMVMADHMAVIALKLDYLGVNGQGAGDEPLGLLNQLINVVTFGGSAANAYQNSVLMETLIRASNVPDPVSYITTSTARGMLKSTARLLKGATTVVAEPVWGDDDDVNGRPAWDSQQIPNNVMIAGAFRHFVMAQWGGLAVVLDTISQASQDKYWLNINTYIDFALRHNQAFTRSTDSLSVLA